MNATVMHILLQNAWVLGLHKSRVRRAARSVLGGVPILARGQLYECWLTRCPQELPKNIAKVLRHILTEHSVL